MAQSRFDKSIAEAERALALDPAAVNAYASLGAAYLELWPFEKSLEFLDKAILLTPGWSRSVLLVSEKGDGLFAAEAIRQAIEWARRSIAINPNTVPFAHAALIGGIGLVRGREGEARDALQRYLALPPAGLKTIAAWPAFLVQHGNGHPDPRVVADRDTRAEAPSQGRDARAISATRRLAAIMAIDVVGYSRLMGEDEAGLVRKYWQLARSGVAPSNVSFPLDRDVRGNERRCSATGGTRPIEVIRPDGVNLDSASEN